VTDVWVTIGVLAVVTVAIKAAGPVAVGGRELSPAAARVISLLAPAVLSALVVVGTFSDGRELTLDARAVGLAAAAGTIALRGSLLLVVVVAAVAATGARALGAA
jgi:branched-subunit amino acid transport protein